MKRSLLTVLLLILCGLALLVLLHKKEKEPASPPMPESPVQSSSVPETQPEAPATQRADALIYLTVWTGGALQETRLADYLPGVLAGEMPAGFDAEALKAQAVAARTYILYKQKHGCSTHPEATVCDAANCCKAWLPQETLRQRWGDDFEANMAKMHSAVSETDGCYLSYEGAPIQAVFHSSSAGKTESSANLWKALPYLVSVESPETQADVPNFITEVEVSADALREAVSKAHPAADFSAESGNWLGGVYYNESGRVSYASIGGAAVSGAELREMFALRSTCFTLQATGNGFRFSVTGYGHGVGMSQYGAQVLAEQGATHEEILLHYYPGAAFSSFSEIQQA